MKASLVRTWFACAVVVALVIMGCSKSPEREPGNKGPDGKTANGNFSITRPAYGDTVMQRDYLSVAWTSSTSMTDSVVDISLYKGNNLIATAVQKNTGADTMQIPYTGSGTDYRVRISSASDTSEYDMSSYFSVYSGYSGEFTVTCPTSDSAWTRGTYHYIQWTSSGSLGPVNIQLYNDTLLVSTIAPA